MHLTEVSINNAPPLAYIEFNCDEHVNLFVGPNACGKSTILKVINVLLSSDIPRGGVTGDEVMNIEFLRPDYPGEFAEFFLSGSDDWPRDSYADIIWNAVPTLYVPAVRVNLPGIHIVDQTIDKEENPSASDAPLDDLFDTNAGIFYGQYVEMAINWLSDRKFPNRSQRSQFGKAINVGYSCAKSICPEVMHDNTPHIYIESHNVHHSMGIVTTDNVFGEPLYAGALSSGTQGTLLWVWALALKMARHYGWTEGWEGKPAILLIDEIENHLHPTWQRRVIPALLEHFPKLQIFATTHSPFLVAGLKAGQVHLLHRDENGRVTATTNERDVVGWTADEILRTMMGVDEPTDQLTVDRANRLRQLRGKETLTPEEETELNALRRQVNQDLLSKGGPLEAERERYADLMLEFLRSQQSELAQDGG